MKKIVLSSLLALGLCFGLAAAGADAKAPSAKSGKTVVRKVEGKVSAKNIKKAPKAVKKTVEAEAPAKFAGIPEETIEKLDTTWGIPTLW